MRHDAKVRNALRALRRGQEPGTHRPAGSLAARLTALHAAGWSWSRIGTGAGVAASSAWRAARGPSVKVRATTLRRLTELADRVELVDARGTR
jgi:hypothetical protein